MKIGNISIDNESPPELVCEIGINHNGSIYEAKKIVDAAIHNGARVIKHQTHIVEDEMSNEASNIIPPHTQESIFEIMKNCALNEAEEYELMKYVKSKAITIAVSEVPKKF